MYEGWKKRCALLSEWVAKTDVLSQVMYLFLHCFVLAGLGSTTRS
jgi:hypothetical protein